MTSKKMTYMAALVASCALTLLAAQKAEAGIISHAISGAVGGAVVHKGAEALAKRKEAKAQKAADDKAAGREPAPSVMGKEFDDTLKERVKKVKADHQAAREASSEGAPNTAAPEAPPPSFKATLAERLKSARDAQRAEVAAERHVPPDFNAR